MYIYNVLYNIHVFWSIVVYIYTIHIINTLVYNIRAARAVGASEPVGHDYNFRYIVQYTTHVFVYCTLNIGKVIASRFTIHPVSKNLMIKKQLNKSTTEDLKTFFNSIGK